MSEAFQLTTDQARAVDLIVEAARHTDDTPQVVVIAGFAGTGKTTILRTVAEALDSAPLVLAPTNRAALRVRQAAGLPASTIHKFLYCPRFNAETGEITFERRDREDLEEFAGSASIVIVDEASMLGEEVCADLRAACQLLDLPLALVGDGFQLPPVAKKSGQAFSVFGAGFKCDHRVDLTGIHRGTDVIIRAATLIRQGKVREGLAALPKLQSHNLLDGCSDTIERGGFVICHTNKTRQALNFALRANFSIDGPIAPGEPLMVTRNAYEINRYNGQIIHFRQWLTAASPVTIARRGIAETQTVHFAAADVDGSRVIICPEEIAGQLVVPDWVVAQEGARWARDHNLGHRRSDPVSGAEAITPFPYLSANLGWAITGHKSQGDERPEVVVLIEPSIRFEGADQQRAEEGARWIYTTITRAQKQCRIHFGGVQHMEPAKRRRALKPPTATRILMVADEGSIAADALMQAAGGTLLPVTDALTELVESAVDAELLAEDYAGVVSGPNPSVAARLLASAFKARSLTALRFTGTGFEPLEGA